MDTIFNIVCEIARCSAMLLVAMLPISMVCIIVKMLIEMFKSRWY